MQDNSLSLEGQRSAIQRVADSRKAGVMDKITAAITYLEKSSAALTERMQKTITKDDEMGAEIRAHYKSTEFNLNIFTITP